MLYRLETFGRYMPDVAAGVEEPARQPWWREHRTGDYSVLFSMTQSCIDANNNMFEFERIVQVDGGIPVTGWFRGQRIF